MSDSTNWQEQAAGAWSRAASTYGNTGPAFFQYFGKELVDFAEVSPGARVLDVATGRGAVLFAAAERVGPQGEVTGIDYSDGMVEETNAEIRAKGVGNAKVVRMDAGKLDLADGSFDVVFCAFALFFFPDLDRTLGEFRRVLKPGGRLAVSTWGEGDARWGWLDDLRKLSGPQPQPQEQQEEQREGPRFDTPEGLEEVLSRAGVVDIKVAKVDREFMYASPEEWWATQWSHGSRIFLERLPPDVLERGRVFAFGKMAEIAQPGGVPMLFRALLAGGTRK
jgi:SAM-dependent methyltransferase